jgi:hypothetical protein
MHVAYVPLDVGSHDCKVEGVLPRDEEQHVVDVRRPGQRRTTIRRLGERRLQRVKKERGGGRVHRHRTVERDRKSFAPEANADRHRAGETLLKHIANNNNNRAARGKMGHQSTVSH